MNELEDNRIPLQEFHLWERMKQRKALFSFDIELTARCNNNCSHCYINLPRNDKTAQKKELTRAEISSFADEAISLGALWCLLTGGEPLLRDDFSRIYLDLKRKGLLVSLFTNATLINEDHIKLFKEYPPRDVEITVYGVTRETHERVTRREGSFDAFIRGVKLLGMNRIKVRFKAMALRHNLHEMGAISQFCRENSTDFFRFDPFLHLRFDRDEARNAEIRKQRLSPAEVVRLETMDEERISVLEKSCDRMLQSTDKVILHPERVFSCGVGTGSLVLGWDGYIKPCSPLIHPECTYNLREGSLTDAWRNFMPKLRDIRSKNSLFIESCGKCHLKNLCFWCPAHAYLEAGSLDTSVEEFCEMTAVRLSAIKPEEERVDKESK